MSLYGATVSHYIQGVNISGVLTVLFHYRVAIFESLDAEVIEREIAYTWHTIWILKQFWKIYRQISNTGRTLVGNKFVDHSNVGGSSVVGAAPATSSISTWYMASMDWEKTPASREEKPWSFGIWCAIYIRDLTLTSSDNHKGWGYEEINEKCDMSRIHWIHFKLHQWY